MPIPRSRCCSVCLSTAQSPLVFISLPPSLSLSLSLAFCGDVGRFFAYFGANVKTVLVAMQTYAVVGVPLLMPVLLQMKDEIKTIADFNPVSGAALSKSSRSEEHLSVDSPSVRVRCTKPYACIGFPIRGCSRHYQRV